MTSAFLRSKSTGVGLALGKLQSGQVLAGVDLDQCRDPNTGAFEPWATSLIAFLNSYTEISPSGTGAKVFLFGSLPEGATEGKRYKAEIYSHSR